MSARNPVESYKFWDLVELWSKDELESEEIVARALVKGVVRDGLRVSSTELRWVKKKNSPLELEGVPYVGFCANPGAAFCVLRPEALEHLLAVTRDGRRPSRRFLRDEFILREDFRHWLRSLKHPLPAFWFPGSVPIVYPSLKKGPAAGGRPPR